MPQCIIRNIPYYVFVMRTFSFAIYCIIIDSLIKQKRYVMLYEKWILFERLFVFSFVTAVNIIILLFSIENNLLGTIWFPLLPPLSLFLFISYETFSWLHWVEVKRQSPLAPFSIQFRETNWKICRMWRNVYKTHTFTKGVRYELHNGKYISRWYNEMYNMSAVSLDLHFLVC